MSLNQKLGKCGVFCAQCSSFTGEMTELASKIKVWTVRDYSWLKDSDEDFDFDNFLKGLDWFIDSTCPGCRNVKESWCDVKKCEKIQQGTIDNCLVCEDFASCKFTDYQKNRYSYLFEHRDYIKKEGFEKYLEREEKKAKEGIRIQEIRDY